MSSHDTAKAYWDDHAHSGVEHTWVENQVVAATVYERMTGGQPKHWLAWLMDDYFRQKTFRRMLSPGCGSGAHELIVARTGKVKEIDAFDLSGGSVEAARAGAASASLKINFYQDNSDTFTLPEGRQYDLVLCSGAVHHVRELERFFRLIARALAPGGYFVVNEYVGACYNIYGPKQVGIVNRLLARMAGPLLAREGAQYRNTTIEHMLSVDPSESVRAKLIPPFLKSYFDVELERPFGGSLLHPMYPLLNAKRFAAGDPATDTVLRLLMEFEAILIEEKVLETDFVLYVARPRGTLPDVPGR